MNANKYRVKSDRTTGNYIFHKSGKKRISIIFIAFLLTLVPLLLTGCSKDKKEEALKTVLEQIYNCPDTEITKLRDQAKEALKDSNTDTGIVSADNSAFLEKMNETYQPYFSEKAYEIFLDNRTPSRYHFDAADRGYTTKTDKIEMERNDRDKSNYSFTLHLKYLPKDGNEQSILLKGSADFSEDNKITALNFEEDLLKLLDNNK